jgi:hypothetical protein
MSSFKKGTMPQYGGGRREESHFGKKVAHRAHRRGVKVRLQKNMGNADLDPDQDTNTPQTLTKTPTTKSGQ